MGGKKVNVTTKERATIYVAANGTRYHKSKDCTALARTRQVFVLRPTFVSRLGSMPCTRCYPFGHVIK
jgi:hypothetical protein